MIESLYSVGRHRERHLAAPLLLEREQYLSHLQRQGAGHHELILTAVYLLHIVQLMNLTALRMVAYEEINAAGERWAAYDGPFHRYLSRKWSSVYFIRFAKRWFHFLGQLPVKPRPPFYELVTQFAKAQTDRGLSPTTVEGYRGRTQIFLSWLSEHRGSLATVSLSDIDDFILERRARGYSLPSIASLSQSLRSFFRFAEERGLCVPGLPLGIRSPSLPLYSNARKGPSYVEVRRLIRATTGNTPARLRAKAVLLLFAVYGLRSSEVSGLLLSDFDWQSETFTVRRAKRGGIQQFPIQFEVGEAILDYLKRGRPRTTCRQVFVNIRRPFGPIQSGTMWKIVGEPMRQLGICLDHIGPHCLRHYCATYLLKKGHSLKDIADFLGHRDPRSVGIYAKYDMRLLRRVAAFRLGVI